MNIPTPHQFRSTDRQQMVSREVQGLLLRQRKAIETALLPGGQTSEAYLSMMAETITFLNSCLFEDIAQIKTGDLEAQVSWFIQFVLKISNEEVFLDIYQLHQLEEMHLSRSLKTLTPLIPEFDKPTQVYLGRLIKKRQPGLVARMLRGFKITKTDDPAAPPPEETSFFDNETYSFFDLLVMEHLLQSPDHLHYEQGLKWLSDHFEGNLQHFQKHLQDMKQKQEETKEGQKHYLLTGGTSRDNHFLTHFLSSMRLDHPLQYEPFGQYRAKWRFSNQRAIYEATLKACRIAPLNEVLVFKRLLQLLNRATFFIRQAANPESGPNLNLEADYLLEACPTSEYNQHHTWKEQDATEYFRFAIQTLIRLKELYDNEKVAAANPHVSPLLFEEVTKARLEEYSSAKRAELDRKLETFDIRGKSTKGQLEELVRIHRCLRDSIATSTGTYLGYFLLHHETKEDKGFMGKTTHIFYRSLTSLYHLHNRVSRLLFHTYLNLEQFQRVPLEDLRYCMFVYRQTGYSCLHALELQVFNQKQFQQRYMRAREQKEPKEVQFRLLLLLEELRTIPTAAAQSEILNKRKDWLQRGSYDYHLYFVQSNDDKLEQLRTQILEQLRVSIQLEFPSNPYDRIVFEAFQIIDYYAGDLQDAIDVTWKTITEAFPDNELPNILARVEALERQILKGCEFSLQTEQRTRLLMELQERFRLSDSQLEMTKNLLNINGNRLTFFLDKIAEIYKFLNDAHQIGDSYQHILTAQDVNLIKQRHTFVEMLTPSHVKAFAYAYEMRKKAMALFLEKAMANSADVPEASWREVNKEVYARFKDDNRVPAVVKLLFLYCKNEHSRLEFKLLNLFLNFTLPDECRSRGTYISMVKMFDSLIDLQNGAYRPLLRNIRAIMNVNLTKYQPTCLEVIYKHNSVALETDIKTILGTKLDQ